MGINRHIDGNEESGGGDTDIYNIFNNNNLCKQNVITIELSLVI